MVHVGNVNLVLGTAHHVIRLLAVVV